MSLSIRSAVPGDAGLIFRFVTDLAHYEKLEHEVVATEADLGTWLFGDNPRVFCEIAEWDGAPAGFALWYYTFSTFRGRHGIWLEDLFVVPEMRGKGIGKALMAHLAGRCADEGLARLEWWVLDWNAPSIDFYKSIGAVLQDEWTVCRVDRVPGGRCGAGGVGNALTFPADLRRCGQGSPINQTDEFHWLSRLR